MTFKTIAAVLALCSPLLWWVGDHELVFRPTVEQHMAESYCTLCYERCHRWCAANGIEPAACQCPDCDRDCR